MPATPIKSLICMILAFGLQALLPNPAAADAAAKLQARYAKLQPLLAKNAYQRPLYLDSTEGGGTTQGDVYVVVSHPFARVVEALNRGAHWCDILILHVNAKYCRPAPGSNGASLQVAMGRKFDQALDDTHRVDFDYALAHSDASFLQLKLNAAKGPMGTKDYRIVLEAVPLPGQQSFIHLSYAYSYGLSARLAMQTYLATLGRAKVGFTVVDTDDQGQPVYVEGVRGAVERNTMRYALAIEAYLGAYNSAKPLQAEKRLRDWFAATERHPLQLREMGQDEYLGMKRKEISRQQNAYLP